MSRQIKTDNRITLSVEQAAARSGGKLIFTDYRGRKAALLIREDRLRAAEFFAETSGRIGAVYICKVKNAVKNLGAYFVEIGGEEREMCFLSEKDAAYPFLLNRAYDGRILEGDEFPVQVTREASKNKQASVTTLLSLSNPYFAFSVGKTGIGFSNKLSPEQKEQMEQLLRDSGLELKISLPFKPSLSFGAVKGREKGEEGLPIGLVVRTRAAELLEVGKDSGIPNEKLSVDGDAEKLSVDEDTEKLPVDGDTEKLSVDGDTEKLPVEGNVEPVSEKNAGMASGMCEEENRNTNKFFLELQYMTKQWETLFQTAAHRTCFSCLREAPAPWKTVLEQLAYPGEYEEILTDDARLYGQFESSIQAGQNVIPADKRLRLYSEAESEMLPFSKLYGLESKLEEALGRKVWLKCGGYLVIEPTEALTVIDVNSGKFEAKKDAEETYFWINREAAEEIARQLRLRNLSGMIVVDFINMKSAAHQKELLEFLRALVRRDKQKTVVVDMTPLGLVEITRKKSSKPLAEQLSEHG